MERFLTTLFSQSLTPSTSLVYLHLVVLWATKLVLVFIVISAYLFDSGYLQIEIGSVWECEMWASYAVSPHSVSLLPLLPTPLQLFYMVDAA